MKFSVASLIAMVGISITQPSVEAAEIKLSPQGSGSVTSIAGRITPADEAVFKRLTLNIERAVVVLSGPGGKHLAALDIAKAVRLKGFATAVVDDKCVSACALIWLAGQPRMMTATAAIGFHAPYHDWAFGHTEADAVGNALLGAYIARLGLGDEVVKGKLPSGRTRSGAAQIGFQTRGDGDGVQVSNFRLCGSGPSRVQIPASWGLG